VGQGIEQETFPAQDRRRFAERCREGLTALGSLLERPGFGAGAPSIGVELEIGLIDEAAQPAPVNEAVRAAAADPALDLELDRFNLELNSTSVPLAGRPFRALFEDVAAGLDRLTGAAAPLGARPVAVGILPTLRREHLGPAAMSDSARFRALGEGLLGLRGGPFAIRIDGPEPLETAWEDLTLEGAATGLHVHLRVPPSAFAATFNAAQTAIAPILAASVNSPILLEHLLWQETRVALFAQAVDDRAPVSEEWLPSRAAFGHGWIAGPLEPFAESVALHVPLLPVVSGDDPMAAVAAGGVPGLDELRLHHGTVWRWNRAVVDPGDAADPHLRIEMRALPAGPSMTDMRANVAYLVGLTMALAPQMEWMCRSMPFEFARRNFTAAARDGLDAVLLWPSAEAPSPRPWPAVELVTRLAPAARAGLTGCGVSAAEADELLGVVIERVGRGATGAGWQRGAVAAFEAAGATRRRALAEMTEAYLERCAGGAPVHEWEPVG
jgi:hypothetical protein